MFETVYSIQDMMDALAAVRDGSMSKVQACKTYKIPRTTLYSRLKLTQNMDKDAIYRILQQKEEQGRGFRGHASQLVPDGEASIPPPSVELPTVDQTQQAGNDNSDTAQDADPDSQQDLANGSHTQNETLQNVQLQVVNNEQTVYGYNGDNSGQVEYVEGDDVVGYKREREDGVIFSPLCLEDVRALMDQFATARDWSKFHQPRNLILAMFKEVGELAELFQWRGEVQTGIPEFNEEERSHVEDELADVMLYLVRLADRCCIDLSQAVLRKYTKNEAKYPPELCRGSSAKYTRYNDQEHNINFNNQSFVVQHDDDVVEQQALDTQQQQGYTQQQQGDTQQQQGDTQQQQVSMGEVGAVEEAVQMQTGEVQVGEGGPQAEQVQPGAQVAGSVGLERGEKQGDQQQGTEKQGTEQQSTEQQGTEQQGTAQQGTEQKGTELQGAGGTEQQVTEGQGSEQQRTSATGLQEAADQRAKGVQEPSGGVWVGEQIKQEEGVLEEAGGGGKGSDTAQAVRCWNGDVGMEGGVGRGVDQDARGGVGEEGGACSAHDGGEGRVGWLGGRRESASDNRLCVCSKPCGGWWHDRQRKRMRAQDGCDGVGVDSNRKRDGRSGGDVESNRRVKG